MKAARTKTPVQVETFPAGDGKAEEDAPGFEAHPGAGDPTILATPTLDRDAQDTILMQEGLRGTDTAANIGEKSVGTIQRNSKGRVKGVENTQRHHVVHQKLSKHPLWKKAGMGVEDGINKLFLPTKKGATLSTTERSIHEGRHLRKIEGQLYDKMQAASRIGEQQGYTQDQYRAELMDIIKEERRILKSGHRALNTAQRPWADQ